MHPTAWPKYGRGILTWPLYKACEPHVVLIGLTGLAILAILAPAAWVGAWRAGVIGMAVLAPFLAIARASRAVTRRAVTAEFAEWFRESQQP
jgi:hypothetical protein